jgi:peptidoglycan/LPS O-acetylase OafA/YrhL
MQTIGDSFDRKRNSLNALRLALALLVIVAHSWPLNGYGAAPDIGGIDPGNFAVAAFFAISGYLITGSRLSSERAWNYYWRRFLRIYPAFFVSLVVIAFGLAPLSVALSGGGPYDWQSGLGYIYNNAALMIRQWGIDGTLQDVSYPNVWNGSTWTLFYEVLCYIAVGLLISVLPKKWTSVAVIVAASMCIAVTAFHIFVSPVREPIQLAAELGGFFLCGAIILQYRDRIPVTTPLLLGSVAAIVTLAALGVFEILGGLPVAYLVMYLGIKLPLSAVGARNDFSYGMYIFAVPVQQILATALPRGQLPLVVFMIASVVGTAPFAIASWFLVEKQAMKLKNLFAKTRSERIAIDPQPGPTQPQL